SAKMIISEIEDSQARDITTTDPEAACSFSWTFQPMAGGGTVVLVEDITERKIAEARISHLARFDELTGLPNRVNFRDEIERLLAISYAAERLSALLFVDLDQFKQVNDTLSHPCGDELLCSVANRKSGRIATCEALLRWNHPVRGTVSPVDIIPVAEDMGLIVDLGRWILRKACMECMKWPEGVSVAVNFSPQQFHQRDVLSEVRYALEVSGLPAHRLEIEITESSLLRNTQLTHDVLSQLRTI